MKKLFVILGLIAALSFAGCIVEPYRVWVPEHYIYYSNGTTQFVPGHYEEGRPIGVPIIVGVGFHGRR